MARAREQAIKIWRAGIDRVRAERLIGDNVHCEVDRLSLCSTELELDDVEKVCVVGAGKAAGYLAIELANVLRPISESKQLFGLVNVPANCVEENEFIQLHAARPAGINEPRPEGVIGTQQILQMVAALQPHDICICLITGGGSALLPGPKPPVTLDDKQRVTRLLSARGASIQEMNCVRIALSEVKGGGLARKCGAHQLVTLIVSDIIGDPLELIASGPTIPSQQPKVPPSEVLANFVKSEEVSPAVWAALAEWQPSVVPLSAHGRTHHLLANNQTAVEAAQQQAQMLGLEPIVIQPESAESTAEEVASQLVECVKEEVRTPSCIIWGGEPVVRLKDAHGRGGRNQQLALAALSRWGRIAVNNRERLCILSGGTDGEDGPTDAAGAFVDADVVQSVQDLKLDACDSLKRCDAYPFFEAAGGLLKTGPTHTNVCDLRVVVVT